jgi:hypothetical protein
MSMLVMVICFPLHSMGLFGSVDGPLNPARIGESLAGLGATRTHFALIFLSFLIIAVTWNWIFNWVSLIAGNRLTCKREMEEGVVCGASVKRTRATDKKTGRQIDRYVCIHGHKRADAHFHPVRKGTFSNCLWVVSMTFCLIVLFLS